MKLYELFDFLSSIAMLLHVLHPPVHLCQDISKPILILRLHFCYLRAFTVFGGVVLLKGVLYSGFGLASGEMFLCRATFELGV